MAAKDVVPDPADNEMGFVISVSDKADADGNRHTSTHTVRIACEHWGDLTGTDCRFGCGAKARKAA